MNGSGLHIAHPIAAVSEDEGINLCYTTTVPISNDIYLEKAQESLASASSESSSSPASPVTWWHAESSTPPSSPTSSNRLMLLRHDSDYRPTMVSHKRATRALRDAQQFVTTVLKGGEQ